MGIILDLIVLAIIILFVIISAKKGFVKTLIQFAGILAAIYLATTLSAPIANFTYEKAIEPAVVSSINNTLNNVAQGAENAVKEEIFEVLPSFVQNRVDISELNFNQDGSNIAKDVCESVVKPISITFLKSVYTLIIFIILSIVVKILANIINKLFSFSVIGKANRILGGVIGVLQGIIFAIIFIIVANLLITLTGGFLCFTKEAVASSYLFSNILKILPFNF